MREHFPIAQLSQQKPMSGYAYKAVDAAGANSAGAFEVAGQFSEAMAAQPKVFNRLCVNMVRA